MAVALAGMVMVVPLLARDEAVAIGVALGFAFLADVVGAGHIGGIV
jgi:hypothetical protein